MADGTEVAAGATGLPATTTSTVTEPKSGEPTAAEVLAFDPFAPSKEPEPKIEPKLGEPAKVEPVKVEPKLGADGKPIAEPAKVEPAPVVAAPGKSLEQLIHEQTAVIQQSLAKPEPAKVAEPEKPRFTLGVPEPLVQALASEDPKERGLALNAVVSGVANHVWGAVQESLRENLATLVQSIPQVIAAHTTNATQQEAVARDFFGTYKMFEGEGFRPILQASALEVGKAWQAAGKPIVWNAEFRDATAERMFTTFPMLRPAANNAGGGGGGGGNPPKIPFSTGGGGGRQPVTADQSAEFMEVLKTAS